MTTVAEGEDLSALRDRVHQFLSDQLPSDWEGIGALAPDERAEFRTRWRRALLDHGYLGISWPREYGGRGFTVVEEALVQEKFSQAGVPLLPFRWDMSGMSLLGPTLLQWGSEAQRREYLPRILSGEDRWCQGYSEPDAGSDLFSLRTTGVVSNRSWMINGQKTWTSHGDEANWIFALVRTEPDAPNSTALSFLLIPLDQPGVDVRPVTTMTGDKEFSEVFFTDASTDLSRIVGERGQGVAVAMSLLGHERSTSAGAKHVGYAVELRRLVELVEERGLSEDTHVRQELAAAHGRIEIMRIYGGKSLAARAAGRPPGAESSLLKLLEAEHHQRVTEFAMEVLGQDAIVRSGPRGIGGLNAEPLGSSNSPNAWQTQYLYARAKTIYGGSAQIQLNTIGERILGLPREARG